MPYKTPFSSLPALLSLFYSLPIPFPTFIICSDLAGPEQKFQLSLASSIICSPPLNWLLYFEI